MFLDFFLSCAENFSWKNSISGLIFYLSGCYKLITKSFIIKDNESELPFGRIVVR